MRKVAILLAGLVLASPFVSITAAQATSTRTWVSGLGSDGGTCTRVAPCATFFFALTQTTPGGEINCLDAGNYGAATITFAVTISCETGTAGIQASSGGVAVNINAATTDDITLRGLDINGLGGGDIGIQIIGARTVHIESCAVRDFRFFAGSSAGIYTANARTIFIYVTDSVFSDNNIGVRLATSGGFKVASLKNVTVTGSTSDGVLVIGTNVFANITESVISGNGGSAVNAALTFAEANVDRTTMANNGVALNASASGATIRAIGNNIFNNTTAFGIAAGATIATDGQNRTGGNAGGQNANASLTLK